jgi:anti-anti-sigma regulatory factor
MESYRFELPEPAPAGTGRATIRIRQLLTNDTGRNICELLKSHIQTGYRNWDICLNEMASINSVTLGICVMMHMTIRRYGAESCFIIGNQPNMLKILALSQLDQVLNIRLEGASESKPVSS